MPTKEELQAAFNALDAHPFKISKDNQLLLMPLEDYEGDVKLTGTRLKAPTFELKGPPVPPPPAKLLDPSFNTKDSK